MLLFFWNFLFIVFYYFALLFKISPPPPPPFFSQFEKSVRTALLALPGNCTKQFVSIACVLTMW